MNTQPLFGTGQLYLKASSYINSGLTPPSIDELKRDPAVLAGLEELPDGFSLTLQPAFASSAPWRFYVGSKEDYRFDTVSITRHTPENDHWNRLTYGESIPIADIDRATVKKGWIRREWEPLRDFVLRAIEQAQLIARSEKP